MPWTPQDADKHTGLANTASRKKLWASTANEILDTTGDEGKAIRIANSAVKNDLDKSVRRKVHRRDARKQDLFRLI